MSGLGPPALSSSSSGGGAVTNAGVFAVQEDGASLTAIQAVQTALETAGGLVVNLGTNNDVTVSSGTITNITNAVAVTGTFWQTTQPISGTITANLGATDNAVLDAIALGYATEGDALGDGVLIQGDDGTDRTNVLVDTAGHLQIDVLTMPTTAVTGTFWQTTQPVSIATVPSHAVTNAGVFAVQEDGDSLTALQNIDSDTSTIAAIDFMLGTDFSSVFGTSSLVSATPAVKVEEQGTVTVDLGLNNDVTLATLPDTAAGDLAAIAAALAGTLTVTGGGGGTEYTEDVATANPIVGTATLMERDDALSTVTPIEGDWIGLRGTAEGALWTQDFNSDAALALLGTIDTDTGNMATSLGSLDNAVDGNYLNVNLNLAGTDVTAGAGAVAAGTPRVTLASDDPAVALLGTIDSDTSTLAGAVSAGQMQVDIVADGAGLLTSANFAAAFGTAGSADSQVMSVQGIASMTPILVDATGQGDVPITLAGETVVLGAGTAAFGKLAANSGVDIGDVTLTAGTAAIGKLAANSGVDIGDVDVTSVPRSLSGPGQPGTAIDSYTHAPINLAAGANQVLVASAANKQIWVYGIGFTTNAAGTVSFQDEDDTAISGIMPFATNSGLAIPPSGNFSMPIWKLATDKDLEVDIVTSEVDGWIDYAIISV